MKNPIYSAIAAVTMDGKIATHARQFTNWTSKEDKDFLHKLLDRSDVVVVGHNTYKTAKKPLDKRNCIVMTRSVSKIVQKNSKLVFLNPTRENLDKFIRRMGYRRVAILGGAQTYTYFLEKNLIDEIYLTIEPLVFGRGMSMFESAKVLRRYFKLVSVKRLNKKGSLVVHYKA
ncbi:MAG: dihydrofolate reductase [Candidatus Liptonbacteria bacterium]|nr:dihydrofolate reductase [Candidatus Liptonbacteria bacterium]